MTRIDTTLIEAARLKTGPHAVVIGAGLGGLASAMRLGAMGYRVTVMDRLDVPGGAVLRSGKRGIGSILVPRS